MDGTNKIGDVLVVFNLNTRIYYDMLPVYTNGHPTRIKMNSGDVIMMTGASRYLWSHSYSSNTPLAKNRFNIIFRGIKI
jgi:alkylated DNA repair dioxygenase AlkB